jgi:hypothetical protein
VTNEAGSGDDRRPAGERDGGDLPRAGDRDGATTLGGVKMAVDLGRRLTIAALLVVGTGCGPVVAPTSEPWTLEVAAVLGNAEPRVELWLLLRNNSRSDVPLICVSGWSRTIAGTTTANAAPIGSCDDGSSFEPVLPGSSVATRVALDTDWQTMKRGLSAVDLVFVEATWPVDGSVRTDKPLGSGTLRVPKPLESDC